MESFKVNPKWDESISKTNTQTWREFIRESEHEFNLALSPIDLLDDEEVWNYIDWLDDLWYK